jgi:ribosomal protein S1
LFQESVFGQKKAKRSEVVVAPPKFVKGKTDAVSGLKSMGHGLTGPSPKSHLQNLESLSFNKLNTGCLVLGLVLQINQTGLLISLPGGLTGVVPYNEVSDVLHRKVAESISKEHIKEHGKTVLPPLDTVVRALQVVRCYIIGHLSKGVDSKKKTISLSMRSSLVNKGLAMKHFSIGFPISGCVASKEDHG